MQAKKPSDLTDEQLMKLYQNGEGEAFKALYVRHSPKVFGYLKARIKNKEKMAEIFQEVFIKIHKSKNLYNNNLPLLPWIFTITKSVMIDEIRKDKSFKLAEPYDLEKIPASIEVSRNQFDETIELLNKLPDHQKIALEMRYVSDKTFEEIATSLRVSPSNARQIISRGIKRLRELVSEGGKS